MKLMRALIALAMATCATAAQAAHSPGAIRVTVDGQTRVVRTLGQPTDADFYAPLTRQLRSLWLDVQLNDLGDADVHYQGERIARWPVVTREDRLPDGFDHPTVLRQGDELLVPVRALVALGHGWVDWDDRTRTLTLTPTVRKIELKEGDHGLEVRIEASAPVKVSSLKLSNPPRLAIDITPAWFKVDDAPTPTGVVRGVRMGQFTKETARLALELNGGPVRITGVPQSGTTVTARLEAGADGVKITRRLDVPVSSSPAGAEQSPTAKALARRLTVRRGLAGKPGSRGGFIRRDPSLRLEDAGGVLAGKVICIDPGHGGWKSGAAGLNGLKEGDACMAMAQQLARALREAGATVLMTREGDTHVSLEDRWGFANAQRVDLFISIHCNAMEHHNTMSGSETYYCTPQSLELARALHPQVVQVMGGRDGGIRRRNFAVIRHTTMPSVLLEVGYIDHTGDEAKLGDPGFQEEFGNAIRDGLIRYFGG